MAMEIDVIEKTTTDIKEIDQDYRYKIEQEKDLHDDFKRYLSFDHNDHDMYCGFIPEIKVIHRASQRIQVSDDSPTAFSGFSPDEETIKMMSDKVLSYHRLTKVSACIDKDKALVYVTF